MNILMIPSWYKNENNKIRGSFFREQALMFQKRGHNVYVIFVELHHAFEKIARKIEKYDDNGMSTWVYHIHSYGYAKNTHIYITILQWIYTRLFKQVLNECQSIDIIQAHSFMPAGIVACELGRKFHIPVITTEHSSRVHILHLNSAEERYLKETLSESKRFVCVSNSLKESVQKVCPDKVIDVIPNNVSSQFTYKSRSEKKCFQFICAGNLIESKRQLFLINCFSKAFPTEDVSLVIAGTGEMRETLEKQISYLNESRRIKLIGLVQREEMPQLLNKSDVFVLLSANETFGVSYIEAMACGCPVIATRNGGANEIVTKDNGILINVDDEPEAIKALRYMFYHYNLFDGKTISQLCLKIYGEDSVYERISLLYDEIIKEVKSKK